VFERFTERARQVVVLAQDEARTLKHNYIGTEHILLGLLREEEGLAAQVLEALDITLEETRAEVARIVGPGDELATGQIPFTPRAKRVLELGLSSALSLGHNYIGTEHLLLGIVRENEGVAARILLDFDTDAEKIRNEVIRMLGGPAAASVGDDEAGLPQVDPWHAPQGGLTLENDVAALTPSRRELRSLRRRQVDHAVAQTITPVGRTIAPILLGWMLFGAALGIGVFVGWLIWG
jgi:ATP-dependent Clp protease ATP-binding subunit ClpA